MKFMSYTLTTLAGLCFAGGLFIFSSEGDIHNGPTRNVTGIGE